MGKLKNAQYSSCGRMMPVKLRGGIDTKSDKVITVQYCTFQKETTKRQEMRLEVNEMRMLRWMFEIINTNKIRN